MIKTIASGNSQFLNVLTSSGVYISQHNAGISGAIRFNTTSQAFEVYDGSAWQNVMGHSTVNLTAEAESLLIWAREEKRKQEELEKWADKHPTIRAALEDLQLAQQRLDVVTILCREEDNPTQQ